MIAHHYKELKNFLMSLRDYIDLERGGKKYKSGKHSSILA